MTIRLHRTHGGLAAALIGAAVLAGCGPDAKPVASAADVPGQAAAGPGGPCGEPAGMNLPGPPQPINQVDFTLSPKALRTHKSGCAGVKFTMTAAGTATDAAVVVEQPAGFGFGDSALALLAKSRFDPAAAKPGAYYYNSVFTQAASGDAPAARPSVY